jgi:thymidylate synthase ThyX
MHFCGLRNHESAQYEIRQYAAAAESFLEQLMPVTHAAFVANDRRSP